MTSSSGFPIEPSHRSLATLRPLPPNGLQVDQGQLDGKILERDLAADRPIVGPATTGC